MVRLDAYPIVTPDATLKEAIKALRTAQTKQDASREPFRAVLVADASGAIVGKIGQLAFLRGLEPRFRLQDGDRGLLAQAGVANDVLDSMMTNLQRFEDDMTDLCSKARHIRVGNIMTQISRSIDASASLTKALHQLVEDQQLSLLVTSGGKAVGLLRLSDLFQEMADEIVASCQE
jgi:CBS domain-containing protein